MPDRALMLKMAEKYSTKIKALFLEYSDFSKFMQQFYPKILLHNFFNQNALMLTALVSKMMKIHQN